MSELLHSTLSIISFAVTAHSELLQHVYKFESEKLLNPPNRVNSFYIEKMIFEKSYLFKGLFYKIKMCWRTLV
jgi:hypothetical protein